MKRIRRLLYPGSASGAWTPALASAVLVVAAAVTLGAWEQNDPPRSKVLQACPDAVQEEVFASPAAFEKWLNEDVVYIIDDAERAAFQKLTTPEERACFVAQFWERRNPEPGASVNKFKKEHYRRIAYANSHFAGSSVPGWQTDRGHMYILYGPPDEIDSHPHATPHPWELWGYKHVDGMSGNYNTFTFIDRTGHGDYHLAPSSGSAGN